MNIKLNQTTPCEFASLMVRKGINRKNAAEINAALDSSLLTIGIYSGNNLVAFARLCGDGVFYLLACDIMIDERYRGKGLEGTLIKEIEDYLLEKGGRNTTVIMLADRDTRYICRKFGYKYLDSDYNITMWK